MKKFELIIHSLLLISCNPFNKNKDLITIDQNWEIESLRLNQSTINDFENFSKAKNIKFEKDSIQNDYPTNDTLDYCGNDYNLYTITYKYTNKSLGLDLYFEKNTYFDSSSFKKYEITDFSKIKFQNDFKTILTKKQLNKDFEYNRDSNTYFTESNQKSISIQTTALDKETYEIKSLKVLKN